MIKYAAILGMILCLGAWVGPNSDNINDKYVTEVLADLGQNLDAKRPNLNLEGVSVEAGRSIVEDGFAPKPNGGKTKKQSKHFKCTSCHNTVQEDPDLSHITAEARLQYAQLRNIPYLQGTTLYGAVNRETYYNGDYDKKYGELVEPARNDVREAIKLCAVECAQGRELKDWELESVLAYLWDIGLRMDDLNISPAEYDQIAAAIEGKSSKSDAVALIKSKYPQDSPAHFVAPPADRKAGSGLTGNPENGKIIYDKSCLHCHDQGRYSYFYLDNSKMSFKHLKRHMGKFTRHSIYQVVRWGVYSKSGKRSYMPQYTEERMSEQQLADLRSYIEMRAE